MIQQNKLDFIRHIKTVYIYIKTITIWNAITGVQVMILIKALSQPYVIFKP